MNDELDRALSNMVGVKHKGPGYMTHLSYEQCIAVLDRIHELEQTVMGAHPNSGEITKSIFDRRNADLDAQLERAAQIFLNGGDFIKQIRLRFTKFGEVSANNKPDMPVQPKFDRPKGEDW